MKHQRTFAALFLAAVMAAGIFAGHAFAAQNHMIAAINHLRNARAELQAALADKGGHRERAIGLVNDAIAEVQAGIDYARTH